MMRKCLSQISFIVVARNEEFAVRKCLESIASMPLEDCEIICVDSDSSDRTLEVMKDFCWKIDNFCIIKCSGYVNAAIARNTGLKKATKDIIYFVDGDVELNEKFISKALDCIRIGKADIVTGGLSEIYYDDEYQKELRRVKDRFNITSEKTLHFSGGCFMARRSLTEMVGFMDERMERNQDVDYTLRLSRKGGFIAIPVSMGIHHTLEYNERALSYIKQFVPMYYGMILRKNIKYPGSVFYLLKRNKWISSGILFDFLVLVMLVSSVKSGLNLSLLFLLSGIFCVDMIWGMFKHQLLWKRFLMHYIYPLLIVLGIFFSINNKRPGTNIEEVFKNCKTK